MAQGQDTSSSAYDLTERGLFRDAANQIDQLQDLSLSLRVLRAQIEAHVGTPAKARAQATELLRHALSSKDQAECWGVIARASLKSGQLKTGRSAFDRALAAAESTQDIRVQARLTASHVHSLLNWVGLEAASLEIPRLRQAALGAGDGQTLITAHTIVAEIEAKRGNASNALAHLDVARQHLRSFDNAWLQGRVAIVSYASAMLRSDCSNATQHIEEALECARRSGSREILIPALANLAQITLNQQRFDETRATLQNLLSELRKSGPSIVEFAALDFSMQLALALRDSREAESIEKEVVSLSAHIDDVPPYLLWHELTKVRWSYALGNAEQGLAQALQAIPRLERTSDVDLVDRMKLLAAEGLGRVDQHVRGIDLVTEVANAHVCSLEILAEVARVSGRLLAAENPAASLRHFDQSRRILLELGNALASAETRRECEEVIGGSAQHSPMADVESPSGEIASRIASLLQMGGCAPLLATEVLSLIKSTNCAQSAEINSGRLHDNTTMSNGSRRIHIVDDDGRSCEIFATPKPTAVSKTTFHAIQYLAEAARLISARRAPADQAALWPAQLSEERLGLICSSERMNDLIRSVKQVAGSNVMVLISGETGVGKELFARAVHNASGRSNGVFIPFNCATVPSDVVDSQLFGYRRGAYTGADVDSPGMIRAAAGGTLFLDEIGEMPIETQPKLLRFLESGEILPLGESRPQIVDVRVVAATNANLDQLVAEGRFREDLYYRLNVIRLNVPPLRDRREEIPALVEHFLERYSRELRKPLLRIASETLEYLVLYRWPGNVRQLSNEIRRLVAMAEPGAIIMPAHLSDDIAESRRTLPANRSPRLFNEVVTRIDQPLSAAVEHIERAAIQRALSMTDGRLDEAAKLLGLSRKGLYLKRQRLNLG